WPQIIKVKVALWLINCAIFNSFFVYKNLNTDSKLKYKAFLINVAKAWATDQMVAAEPESDRLSVKKRTMTVYICKCVMPLHKGECFQKYHTLKHFYKHW
ncbi:hypothetical protein B7P43_G07554, partial [Cryptotermes secundus]